jgi:hypothetical protein
MSEVKSVASKKTPNGFSSLIFFLNIQVKNRILKTWIYHCELKSFVILSDSSDNIDINMYKCDLLLLYLIKCVNIQKMCVSVHFPNDQCMMLQE